MIEAEISALLQANGWYLSLPCKDRTRFLYAKKRIGKTVCSRYLKTENKMNELTPEFILERISGVQNTPGDAVTLPGATSESL